METTTVVDANISTADVSKEDLQQQYSALSKLYTEQQVELEKKSQQIYDYKRELTRLTTLEAEYISEIECLQSGERNECERWKSKVQKLEEERNDILNRHIQEIDNLELNLFKKDEEIVELQEQLKRLANSFNINENKDKIEGAQLMNIKLKNEVTSLSEQLVILTERIECFEKQQLVYQEQNLNLKDELNTLKENYICKKQELDEAKDLIENLQEELMSTKIELETTKSKPLQDGSQGNSIFAEVDDKRLELQERMALMKLQYLKMKQERGKLLAEISSLHSSNAMLCDRWETECNDKTEEQDRLEEAYRARIRHLEAQLETYREQIATRPNVISGNLDSDILEFLDNVVGGRNREIAKLEQEINGYSLSRMVLTEQLKESNVEMRSWRAKATKLESQVGKLQTEIDVLTLKQNSETVIDDRRTTNLCPSCIRNKRSIAPVAPSSERRLKDVVADLCRNSNGSILDDFRTVDYSRQLKRSLLKETDLNAKSTVPFLEDAKENIENERQSGLANDNLVKKVQFTDETVDNSHKGGGNLRKAGKVIYCKPMILKKKC